MSLKINISVEVNPTEDDEKIIKALENIFDLDYEHIEKRKELDKVILSIETSNLDTLKKFRSKIKHRNIQTHIKAFLNKNTIGTRTHIYLNKQVAVVGKVSICDSPYECPLGAIILEIEADSLDELENFISWLTS